MLILLWNVRLCFGWTLNFIVNTITLAKESKMVSERKPAAKVQEFNHVQLNGIPANIVFAEDESKKLPVFNLVAYTGGAVNAGWGVPVIIDLAGFKVPKQKIPVRLNHDRDKGVGHTESIAIKDGNVVCEGVFSRETEYARDVISAARNGFPWQVSVGCPIQKTEFIGEGVSVTVNGKTFKGKCCVLRQVILKEVSFVDLGADSETSAEVKLSFIPNQEENEMPKMIGREDVSSTDDANVLFQSQETQTQPGGETAQLEHGKTGPLTAGAAPDARLSAEQHLAERRRIDAITHYGGGRNPELEAMAIAEGWDLVRFKNEYNAALMPSGADIPKAGDSGKSLNAQTLEVIALRAGGISEAFLEKHYKPEMLEFADQYHGAGLIEFVELACPNRHLPRYQRSPQDWLRAAFSSMTLPQIMSNVVNKVLLESFHSVDDQWRKLVSFGSPNDFKKYNKYRMTSDFKFLRVAPDGEIKHGQVGEEAFENKVDTYGIMFSLTRTDIINDDLSALTSIPKNIGMGAAYAVNDAVWDIIAGNPAMSDGKAFFHADHKNLLTGKNLDKAGFKAAMLQFAAQEYAKGRPLNMQPKCLAVPYALKYDAHELLSVNSIEVADKPATTVTRNPFFQVVDVVASMELQMAGRTGASDTTWYLFADPSRLSAFEVAFLNGKQRPTVESADADFNTLGIQFRGYMDFGVAAQDYRAALKVTA